MTMGLRELYQEVIMDHNRNPRNHHVLEQASCYANGHNPLCGDRLTVYVALVDNVVKKVSFIGSGCAISQASASLMTDALAGKTVVEAQVLFHQFHDLLTKNESSSVLGKLSVFAGVYEFPARVKCATLAWHTFDAALKQHDVIVTTE